MGAIGLKLSLRRTFSRLRNVYIDPHHEPRLSLLAAAVTFCYHSLYLTIVTHSVYYTRKTKIWYDLNEAYFYFSYFCCSV